MPGDDWHRFMAAWLRFAGPLDAFDDAVNGDPDSLVGEEDETGFDEFAGDDEDWYEDGEDEDEE